jgi:OFA family oxalate/formate antiporter-like MFS transporter
MSANLAAAAIARRMPFFYGWVVLFAVCCAGFARQGPAVATLSIFVDPMTQEFGWSRTAISGAVSLGGLLAAFLSPMLGPMLDRHGARAMLTFAVGATGLSVAALAYTPSLIYFYVAFCIGRTCFAGPFDLGIYGAVNKWFVRHRPIATAVANVAMMAGLVIMPLIAQFAIDQSDWRTGWLAVGAAVLVVGLVPVWLFVVRQPEDIGLEPDGGAPRRMDETAEATRPRDERHFTRAEAMRTPVFWLLMLYTALVYPVQAGVSLHQAPYLIERGIDATTAALVVSTFSLMSGVSGLVFGIFGRRIGVRPALVGGAIILTGGVLLMEGLESREEAFLAATLFGVGLGSMFTVLPIAWADFFGRQSYGAIRGVALMAQVLPQAAGPLISGILRDMTGDYSASLLCFAGFAAAAAVVGLFAVKPAE